MINKEARSERIEITKIEIEEIKDVMAIFQYFIIYVGGLIEGRKGFLYKKNERWYFDFNQFKKVTELPTHLREFINHLIGNIIENENEKSEIEVERLFNILKEIVEMNIGKYLENYGKITRSEKNLIQIQLGHLNRIFNKYFNQYTTDPLTNETRQLVKNFIEFINEEINKFINIRKINKKVKRNKKN